MKKNILFIGSTVDQIKVMHTISDHLNPVHNCFFTPFYLDNVVSKLGLSRQLENIVFGKNYREDIFDYIQNNDLKLDECGESNHYDLVVTFSTLIIPKNIRNSRIVLLQDLMNEPRNFMAYFTKWFKFSSYLNKPSSINLFERYDVVCVASPGYRKRFIRNGADPDKIALTGIPEFTTFPDTLPDDVLQRGVVHLVTLPLWGSLEKEYRKDLQMNLNWIADGRPIYFKLLPTDQPIIATRKIKNTLLNVRVFTGSRNHLKNIYERGLISKRTACLFTASVIGDKLHIFADAEVLRHLKPYQNSTASAEKIANVCKNLMVVPWPSVKVFGKGFSPQLVWEKD